MPFNTSFAAIRRIWTCESPPLGARAWLPSAAIRFVLIFTVRS
ncbi:hypothetical protein LEP1GSC172_4438 [Leptospira noguchii]|uniref:Uncharacterized protein n=1 Tax=Leptospira noguchii TaxID=28182 RepID=M6V8T0_9LEPT|nr:hypothetical protein LEP1GSC172_4438 [Leptospira noguchii]